MFFSRLFYSQSAKFYPIKSFFSTASSSSDSKFRQIAKIWLKPEVYPIFASVLFVIGLAIYRSYTASRQPEVLFTHKDPDNLWKEKLKLTQEESKK